MNPIMTGPGSAEHLDDQSVLARASAMKWYAPVNLGNGIVMRPWNWPDAPLNTPHMGGDRFEFILRRNLPNLQGKRILDLGCNAGLISIHLARCGAREVVGVDSHATWEGWYEQATFVKEVVEWRCAAHYNVRYVDADIRTLSALDLGRFDVVLALCSVYYLDDEEIERLIRHVATISDLFLIQGNTVRGDHRNNPGVKRRAHPRFLKRALARNGFPFVSLDAPWLYGRPVVVGRKEPRPVEGRRYPRRMVAWLFRKLSYLPYRFA